MELGQFLDDRHVIRACTAGEVIQEAGFEVKHEL